MEKRKDTLKYAYFFIAKSTVEVSKHQVMLTIFQCLLSSG